MQKINFNTEKIMALNNSATEELQSLENSLRSAIDSYKQSWIYRFRKNNWDRDTTQAKHPRLVDVEKFEEFLDNVTLSSTLLQAFESYLNNAANFRFAKASPLRTRLNQAIKKYRHSHNIELIDTYLQLINKDVAVETNLDMQSEDTERVDTESTAEQNERWLEVENTMRKQQSRIANLEEEIATVRAQSQNESALQLRIQELTTTEAQQRERINLLTDELATTKTLLAQVPKTEELVAINSQLKLTSEELVAQKNSNDALQTALKEANNSLVSTQAALTDSTAKMQELEREQHQKLDAQLQLAETLNATNSQLRNDNQQINQQLSQADSNLQQNQLALNKQSQVTEQLQQQIKDQDLKINQQGQCIQDQQNYNNFLKKSFEVYEKSVTELINAFTQVLSKIVRVFKQTLDPQSGKKTRKEIRGQIQAQSGSFVELLDKQKITESEISIEGSYKRFISNSKDMQQLFDNFNADTPQTPTPSKLMANNIDSPANQSPLRKQKLNFALLGKAGRSEKAIDEEYQSRFKSFI